MLVNPSEDDNFDIKMICVIDDFDNTIHIYKLLDR